MQEVNGYKRLEYLDFCKVFAMYLVTIAHCAQQLSGSKYPDLLTSKDSFISINMAIFMIASGFVMNMDKMKSISTKDYIWSKVIRLLLPMTTWYLVMCVVTMNLPSWPVYWSQYWYLGAMFVCLSTIKILTNFISRLSLVCILSILILSLIPMISFERSCYMIPFLWLGYSLRYIIDKINWRIALSLLALYVFLYFFWDITYSIYMSPFHIWNVDAHMLDALLFRFLIGGIGGVGVIALSRLLINKNGFGLMRHIAKFGRYTLVFYTMSFVLNAILARFMWHFNCFITTSGLLDMLAFIISALMMVLMYYFQAVIEKNCVLRCLFLGE